MESRFLSGTRIKLAHATLHHASIAYMQGHNLMHQSAVHVPCGLLSFKTCCVFFLSFFLPHHKALN